MCNKLWYFAGPRIATAADPAGDQHWCFNVTGDDPAFNPDYFGQGAWTLATPYVQDDQVTNGGTSFICIEDNTSSATDEPGVGANWQTYWTVLMVPPGGRNSPPASAFDNPLGVLRIDSQALYGVRMDIQIFDAYDECGGVGAVGRDLFRKRWQQESWLRAQPRQIIHITPTRETEIGTFDIGDLVGVEADSAVRGGFSGVQRVYEYTVSVAVVITELRENAVPPAFTIPRDLSSPGQVGPPTRYPRAAGPLRVSMCFPFPDESIGNGYGGGGGVPGPDGQS